MNKHPKAPAPWKQSRNCAMTQNLRGFNGYVKVHVGSVRSILTGVQQQCKKKRRKEEGGEKNTRQTVEGKKH